MGVVAAAPGQTMAAETRWTKRLGEILTFLSSVKKTCLSLRRKRKPTDCLSERNGRGIMKFMTRNIDRDDYESYDEFQDDQAKDLIKNDGRGKDKGGLALPEPVVFAQSIMRWAEQYECVEYSDENTEYWTLGDIRQSLVGSVPFGYADPMQKIKDVLDSCGFFATYNAAFGEIVYQLRHVPDMIYTTNGEEVREREVSLY